MAQPAHRIGEILQQVDVNVEADDKGFIPWPQRVLKERGSDFFLHIENAHLAAAGINKDAESQRKIGFGFEILYYLDLPILEEVEVILIEVGDQRSVLVFDVKE